MSEHAPDWFDQQKQFLEVVQQRHADILFKSGIATKAFDLIGDSDKFKEAKPTVIVEKLNVNGSRERVYAVRFAQYRTATAKHLQQVLRASAIDMRQLHADANELIDPKSIIRVANVAEDGFGTPMIDQAFTNEEFHIVRELGEELVSLKEDGTLPALHLVFGTIGSPLSP